MKTISIAIIGIAIGMIVMLSSQSKIETFGNTTLPVGGTTYNLAGSGVSASASSITLASLTIPQTGQKLQDSDFSDTFYITIDPGSRTKQEFVSCTTVTQNASSATLSGCSRGLSPISPYTASSSLQFAHAGGAQVIFSNPPQLYNQFAAKGNDEAVTGAWTFAYTNPPAFTYNLPSATWTSAASSTIVTKGYVDAVSIVGAADATTLVKGIVEIATQAEAASSTSLGGTGATIVLPASMATDTPSTGTRTGRVLMSDLNGYIKQAWLRLTEAFTFSGGLTSSATTTIAASSVTASPIILNGIAYRFPTTQGASSTAIVTDGSGNLSFGTVPYTSYLGATTSAATYAANAVATSTTLGTLPAGALGYSGALFIDVAYSEAASGVDNTIRANIGNNTICSITIPNNASTGWNGHIRFTIFANNSMSSQTGFVTASGGGENGAAFNIENPTALCTGAANTSSSNTITVTIANGASAGATLTRAFAYFSASQ